MSAPVNVVVTKAGQLRAVCEFCGRRSRPTKPDPCGRVDLWGLARGWSSCPFPDEYVHADGSAGTTYTCPDCDRRLDRGEALATRDGALARRLG